MYRYLRILSHGRALRPFIAAVIARLPISMAPLGMVLLIQNVRGSYAVAGAITAAFALSTSVATPLWGRLLDRVGQPAVIAGTSIVSALCLAGLAVSAVSGGSNTILLVLAGATGLAFPPVSPAMREAWRVVLVADLDRRAAYALDAVAMETIFVAGPLLLSALLVLTTPVVPLLVTAGLLAVGGAGYGLTYAARQARAVARQAHESLGARGQKGRSPLGAPGVLAVLMVTLAMAVGFGHLDVSIAATAQETYGSQARVGLLFAAIAGGSALGGLFYGSREWRGQERRRLPVALAVFGAGLFALALLLALGVPALAALLPLLLVTGLFIAPAIIIQANLIDQLAPPDRLGEAQSWLNTGFTAGGAAGTALGGILVDIGGPALSLLGAALALTGGTVLAVVAQGRWRRSQSGVTGLESAGSTESAGSAGLSRP